MDSSCDATLQQSSSPASFSPSCSCLVTQSSFPRERGGAALRDTERLPSRDSPKWRACSQVNGCVRDYNLVPRKGLGIEVVED